MSDDLLFDTYATCRLRFIVWFHVSDTSDWIPTIFLTVIFVVSRQLSVVVSFVLSFDAVEGAISMSESKSLK